MKYTNEELSRILSAHEGRQLEPGGHSNSFTYPASGCVNQVAYYDECTGDAFADRDRNRSCGLWFDRCYNWSMDTDELLANLERESAK